MYYYNVKNDNQIGIFFGSEDGYLYGIDINGNYLDGWPQNISGDSNENKVNSSPVFADLDNDQIPEVITASEEGLIIIYNIDGTPFENFPISYNYGFISSPTVLDIDNDNDMEIIIGSAQNLSVIDLKQNITTAQDYWNTYRGDNHRSGVYTVGNSNILIGDLNADGIINILDLVSIVNIIIGATEPNASELVTADLNNDGIIDVLDLVQLLNLILNS